MRIDSKKLLLIIVILIIVLLAVILKQCAVKDYYKSELGICRETKTYDIRQINIDKTGKYYFEDSIFAVELVVWDSLHSGKFNVTVNLNEFINYDDGKQKERKMIKGVICE